MNGLLPFLFFELKRKLGEGVSHEASSTEGKFHNTNVEDNTILEVCAGSARLTKTARAAGFKGVAVDHSIERSCGVDICIFDLTDPSHFQLSDQKRFRQGCIDYLHVALQVEPENVLFRESNLAQSHFEA